MKTEYDIEAWAQATTRGRRLFIYNYELSGGEFEGWQLLKVHLMSETSDSREKISLWQPANKQATDLVRISVTELPNWRSAQKRLQDELRHCMRPSIPPGTGKLAHVGDVNFVGREPASDLAGAVIFSRGNLCVTVRTAGDRTVDVSEMSCSLDQQLTEPPTRQELRTGRALAKEPKYAVLKSGDSIVLIPNLPKLVSNQGWLKVIAPDGEFSRKDAALIYTSPKGGKKRIEIYLIRAAKT